MLWKTVLRILLLILLGYIIFDSHSLLKIEEIWFGCDHGFGLINTWLGVSSWDTSYGVCAFGTDWASLVYPRSEGNKIIEWVGSRLLNTNSDLYGVLADYNALFGGNAWNELSKHSNSPKYLGNDVHTLGYLIDPRCLGGRFLNFGACFPFRRGREMWSFPSKGGGDDANLKTTIVGKIFYWNNVFVWVVLAHIWTLAWFESWNGTYLVLVVRHLVSRTLYLFAHLELNLRSLGKLGWQGRRLEVKVESFKRCSWSTRILRRSRSHCDATWFEFQKFRVSVIKVRRSVK